MTAAVWPAAIEQAGFSITRLDRFLFPEARTPVSFHIIGQATKRCGTPPPHRSK